MATVTGWICVACIVLAAIVPIGHRIVAHKRAAIGSVTTKSHVAIGAAAAIFAFLHTTTVLPELGSSTAIAAGATAIAPGGLAFFVIVAHVGIGLRLRKPDLKRRVVWRRRHAFTTATIAVATAAHAALILRAG